MRLEYKNGLLFVDMNIGKNCLEDVNIDFGLIDEEGYINGLLGLDVLLKLGITINLKELILYSC